MPTRLRLSEGNTGHGVTRQSCTDPARSKTLGMLGSDLHGSWEVSTVCSADAPDGFTDVGCVMIELKLG